MTIAARRARRRYCKTAGRERVIRVQPRLVSGRKPEPPRSPGFSGSACGAAGRNANDRFCSASVDGTPADASTIKGCPGVVKRIAAARQARLARVPIATRCCAYNRSIASKAIGNTNLASTQELSAFLAEVERRAFKQAVFAVRDEEAALDVVQDAMLKLIENYAAKPVSELPMLFQRILQNTIHDHFRRQKVRSTWTTLLSVLGQKDEKDEEFDPLETLAIHSDSNDLADPA